MFSTVVQGPLNAMSLNNLEYYKSIGPVVISYWESDDKSILDSYNLDGCTLVEKPMPPESQYIKRNANKTFQYQLHSILYGVEAVETEFVIRTRSDEFCRNLVPIRDKFLDDTFKIVCANIFFKKWGDLPFHFGDHLFMGRTETILKAYTALRDDRGTYDHVYCAEQAAAKALMTAAGLEWTREDFVKLFDVVDINLCKPFFMRSAGAGKLFNNQFGWPGVITDIKEI